METGVELLGIARRDVRSEVAKFVGDLSIQYRECFATMLLLLVRVLCLAAMLRGSHGLSHVDSIWIPLSMENGIPETGAIIWKIIRG